MDIYRLGSTQGYYLFIPSKRDRPGWANTGAHRFQSFRRAVITHVAFHLQVHLRVVFRHAERTGIHAVATVEAARLQGRHDDAVLGNFDRIRGTDERAGRLVAMHANSRHRGGRFGAIDVVDKDHRVAFVRRALAARSHTRAAANAALRIDEHRLFHN